MLTVPAALEIVRESAMLIHHSHVQLRMMPASEVMHTT